MPKKQRILNFSIKFFDVRRSRSRPHFSSEANMADTKKKPTPKK